MNDFLYDIVNWFFNKLSKVIEWLDNNRKDVLDEIDEFLKMFD